MKVNYVCFASLAENYECDYKAATPLEIAEDSTVGTMIADAGVADGDVKIVMVNGLIKGRDHALSDGDRVALVPPTAGM